MIIYAVVFFAIAAIGGLYLAGHVFRDRFAPWTVSLLHAGLGALGLIILVVALVKGAASQTVLIGFVIMVLAALGGFFLAAFHLRKRLAPKPVVLVHAGAAVVGFLTILSQVI